jgi:hypothetical protein
MDAPVHTELALLRDRLLASTRVDRRPAAASDPFEYPGLAGAFDWRTGGTTTPSSPSGDVVEESN